MSTTAKQPAVKPVTAAADKTKPDATDAQGAARPSKPPFDAKAHLEALDRLEHLLGSTMSDESKKIIAQFAKTVRARLKPYARTTFIVD